MSKKVIRVSADASREMNQNVYGCHFYSAHKPEDIENWLKDRGADSSIGTFDSIFDGEWEDVDAYCIDNFSLDFEDTDMEEDDCIHDEDIQEFLDDAPKRELYSISKQFTELMGNIQGVKDTALELFNNFKKVVKTDDGVKVKNLSEEEQKMYHSMTRLIKNMSL
ncbi:MAG: hypothetical protein H8D80_00400 [Proteobacteria bacterium]|nr:hypothetical protein [Pseudomonadota bacterium]